MLSLPGSGDRIAVADGLVYVSAAGTSTVRAVDGASGEPVRTYPVTCCAEGPLAAAPDGSALYVPASEFSEPVILEFDPRRPESQTPRVFSVEPRIVDVAVAIPDGAGTAPEAHRGCNVASASTPLPFLFPLAVFLALVGVRAVEPGGARACRSCGRKKPP